MEGSSSQEPNYKSYITNKQVLELGAGLGLIGILCSLLNPKTMTITDGDTETLKGMRKNVQLNYDLILKYNKTKITQQQTDYYSYNTTTTNTTT